MPGFNIKSIGASHLSELLLDKAINTAFEGFVADLLVGPGNIKQVGRLSGTQDLVPIASGLLADNSGSRPALVASGAPTPKGNMKLDLLTYLCNEYRFAFPIQDNIFTSAEQALGELQDLASKKAGLQVKLSVENELLNIFKNLGSSATFTGVTNTALVVGKEWNNYDSVTSDPVADIIAKITATGATKMFIGRDVANALKQHPKFTGASAGSGVEFLTDAQLIERILGLGLAEVWIAGRDFVNSRTLNLTPSTTRLHNGVAAMWSDGALVKYEMESFFYDIYDDKDTRKTYFRANETSVIKSAYAEAVGTFTNVLE